MNLSQVNDWSSLRSYLEGASQREQVKDIRRLNFVVAARVFPLCAHACMKNGPSDQVYRGMLPFFGTLCLAGLRSQNVSFFSPRPIADQVSMLSNEAVLVFEKETEKVINTASSDPGFFLNADSQIAATRSAKSASLAVLNSINDSLDGLSQTVHYASKSLPLNIFQDIRQDLRLGDLLLWRNGAPHLILNSWNEAKKSLLEFPGEWAFWTQWYEKVLNGEDWLPQQVSDAVSSVQPKAWRQGPLSVNPKFQPVLDGYLAGQNGQDGFVEGKNEFELSVEQLIDATPIAAEIAVDEETNAVKLVSSANVAEAYLTIILAKIRSANHIFEQVGTGENAYASLSEETELLGGILDSYYGDPVLIHNVVMRVISRVNSKIKSGVCPENDVNIEDFIGILSAAKGELEELSDELKEYLRAVRPDVEPSLVADITELGTKLGQIATEEFANRITENIAVLNDEKAPLRSKAESQYWLSGVLVRAWQALRPGLKETAAVVKEVGTVTTAAVATGSSIAWLVSPTFREFIDKMMKTFGFGA